ncbi:uncharacterized protein LOC132040957 [Lycium ferocissimum]|uniref:uncharacterized protein LOC132040957 n=1 Tax=Lycium ferocissimum TaxID=112874 RepID=UPI0028161587|nr:uncharacterized protein LOC132040957 [Lycium ferocissimum]
MKGNSKVVTAAALVMVVSLAIVLGLVLVLVAELYCSLLIRRRRHLRKTPLSSTTSATVAQSPTEQPQQQQNQSTAPSTLSDFYAQGVLHAPRNFLFPAVTRTDKLDLEMQSSSQVSSIHYEVGLIFSSPQSHSFISIPSPKLVHRFLLQCSGGSRILIIHSVTEFNGCWSTQNFYMGPPLLQCSTSSDIEGHGGATKKQLVYISNPIYDNEACRPSRGDTPFETPDSSPSCLETIPFPGKMTMAVANHHRQVPLHSH